MRAPILFAMLLLACVATAQELPMVVPDRAGRTVPSSVVPTGAMRIETGIDLEAGWNGGLRASLPTILVRFGAHDWMELRAMIEYWQYRLGYTTVDPPPEAGVGFGFGAKMQVVRPKGVRPEIALRIQASRDISIAEDGSLVPEFRFLMHHSFQNGLGLGYNIGWKWSARRERLMATYTVSLGIPTSAAVSGHVGFFGDYDHAWNALDISLDAGILHDLEKNLQLDFSIGWGIEGNRLGENFLRAGLSWQTSL